MNIEGFIRASASFSDFFEKAKELTNKERGDAFERVVQLHLQSKPKYASELDEVWQLNEVPAEVRKYLKLPNADEGIDLIAKYVDGTYWANGVGIAGQWATASVSRVKQVIGHVVYLYS